MRDDQYEHLHGIFINEAIPIIVKQEIKEAMETKRLDFIKHDTGKIKWNLLPIEPVEDVIKTMMHGEIKYDADNWKKCNEPTKYYNAALRHIFAYGKGESIDPDSGDAKLKHLACGVANLLFLIWLEDYKNA